MTLILASTPQNLSSETQVVLYIENKYCNPIVATFKTTYNIDGWIVLKTISYGFAIKNHKDYEFQRS